MRPEPWVRRRRGCSIALGWSPDDSGGERASSPIAPSPSNPRYLEGRPKSRLLGTTPLVQALSMHHRREKMRRARALRKSSRRRRGWGYIALALALAHPGAADG